MLLGIGLTFATPALAGGAPDPVEITVCEQRSLPWPEGGEAITVSSSDVVYVSGAGTGLEVLALGPGETTLRVWRGGTALRSWTLHVTGTSVLPGRRIGSADSFRLLQVLEACERLRGALPGSEPELDLAPIEAPPPEAWPPSPRRPRRAR